MIENNLILSSESVISNFSQIYSEEISQNLNQVGETQNFYIQNNDLSLFNFKDNSNIVTNEKNTSYFLGDLVKLYYIYYPLIFYNFFLNNIYLETGFLINYQIPLKDYENHKKNNFASLQINPYYFNYPQPIGYDIISGMNFNPFEINVEPVPYFLAMNLTNFNLSKHWYTYYDYLNLYDYNKRDIVRVPNICYVEEKINLKEQSAPFTIFNRNFKDTKIFFTIGFKILKSSSDLKYQRTYEYFELLNMYDNSTLPTLLNDFNNDKGFVNTNLTSKYSSKYYGDSSKYYSFDNSMSTIFRLPLYFEVLFRSGMDEINKSFYFKDYNINTVKVKDLLNFLNFYNVNYYFTSDSLFMIFVYMSNMYNFLADSYLNDINNIEAANSNSIFRNFSSIVCSNINFYEYRQELSLYNSIDCLSNEEINKIENYMNSYSGRTQIGYKMLPHCYCIPFTCLDLKNETFVKNFIKNKTNIVLSKNPIGIPDQCRIDFKNRFDNSVVNDFRFLGNRFKIGNNYTDLVLLFTVSDSEKTKIYNIYTESSISIRYLVLIIYSILLICSLIIFMIKLRNKLGVFKKRIDFLSLNYLDIINKDYILQNLKELTPKEMIIVKDLARNIIEIENQDNYTENDPINRKNLITLNKFKRRTGISTNSLNKEILYKMSNTLPDKELEKELKVDDGKDELEEIYSILMDNVEKFRVEFEFDKVFKFFGNYTDSYQNKFRKQLKIDYLFNYNEEETKEEFNQSLNLIKEISVFYTRITSKYSRNFLFKFALNYLNNDYQENLLIISSDNPQILKSLTTSNYILCTQPLQDEREYVEGCNFDTINRHCFFKSIYQTIEKHLSDLEDSEIKIDFTNKSHVVSIITYYFDKIFKKWHSEIYKRSFKNPKTNNSQISYSEEDDG